MNSSEDDNEGYEVGYGKPPKHSQWQPGQSGNQFWPLAGHCRQPSQ